MANLIGGVLEVVGLEAQKENTTLNEPPITYPSSGVTYTDQIVVAYVWLNHISMSTGEN